jgi:hypothetical protein
MVLAEFHYFDAREGLSDRVRGAVRRTVVDDDDRRAFG